jgi:hypothetical protein
MGRVGVVPELWVAALLFEARYLGSERIQVKDVLR